MSTGLWVCTERGSALLCAVFLCKDCTYFPKTHTADPSAELLKQQMLEWLKKIPERTTCQRFTAVLQPHVHFPWETQLSGATHEPGGAGRPPTFLTTAISLRGLQGWGGGGADLRTSPEDPGASWTHHTGGRLPGTVSAAGRAAPLPFLPLT